MRRYKGKEIVVLANFSESPQVVSEQVANQFDLRNKKVLHGEYKDNVVETVGVVVMISTMALGEQVMQ